ncbi:uncharacterized protein PpBr36_09622 [Pyricularia pennisetigena]|uniref:uncharacterized protein n=1 Tax=Pyricularia pennisetigena TaxID=1578925 RepID=UPI0011548A41|nr:uncharacterized protein PpBr36_09622 [Pyricularia pennisetigena]TLS21690.1 hypothetical protein PpBr36_09622 [Pyricularia pennisetigena]
MTPASASLEKFPLHVTKVLPSCLPEVMGYRRIVLRTEVYVSSGEAVMTEVLLLLHVEYCAVLEGPLDEVRVWRGALDPLGLVELAPKLAKVLELDQVPDLGERRVNDGRFEDAGGGGD